jgi:IS1 family transposase
VRSETWFHHSKLPFQKVWLLVWCWQNKKSIGATKDIVGVSYPTINRWFSRLRQALPVISGQLSELVEMDESFFGKRRYGKQHLVIGAIERKTRKIRLKLIKQRDRATLEEFALQYIVGGSQINTDTWWAYNELRWIGFRHTFHNHSIGQFSETNQIESLWSAIKRHLRTVYRNLSFSAVDLQDILKEWENRQNNPRLFYNVSNYLKATACSGLVK